MHALGLAAQKLQIGERSQTAEVSGKRNKKTKNTRKDAGPDAGGSKKIGVQKKNYKKKRCRWREEVVSREPLCSD